MVNPQLDEHGERNDDQKVADYLGLSCEEYRALAPCLDEQVGDDGLVYRYLVTFNARMPADVAVKIHGLDNDQVSLPPGFFDVDEPEWPQG